MKRLILSLSLTALFLPSCAAPGSGGGKELSPEARAAVAAILGAGVNAAGQYANAAIAEKLKVTPAK